MENWDVNKTNAMEEWDIYTKDGLKAGYTKHRKEALLDTEYHLVVRIWIVNSNGEILLSRRGTKKRGALLWECTGGSVLSGETQREAINRELKEELGIDLSDTNGVCMVKERRDSHHDLYEVWLFRKDINLSDIKIDGEEVIDVKWVNIGELIDMMEKKELMPTLSNFPKLYQKYVLGQ